MFMMYPHYYSRGFFGFGLFPIFIILGFILLVWAFSKHSTGEDTCCQNGETPDEETTALDILKKRYAKGDITKKEFLEMKKEII